MNKNSECVIVDYKIIKPDTTPELFACKGSEWP